MDVERAINILKDREGDYIFVQYEDMGYGEYPKLKKLGLPKAGKVGGTFCRLVLSTTVPERSVLSFRPDGGAQDVLFFVGLEVIDIV